MSLRRWALPLLPALALLAGCSDSAEPAPPAGTGWSEAALAYGESHDHADLEQHRGLSTPNFEVVGHDPLLSAHYGNATAGGYLCGDARATSDGRRIAAVESRSEVGIAVADVTDPADPRWLGELIMPTTRVYDVAVVPDGQHIILVTANSEGTPLPLAAPDLAQAGIEAAKPPAWTWRDACGGVAEVAWLAEDPVPRPMSVIVVSIADPSAPAVIDQHPLFGYGHSAYVAELDGRTLLLVTTEGPEADLTAYELYELPSTPLGRRLLPLHFHKPPPGDDSPVLLGPRGHDGWMADHPVTGQTLAYLAGGERLTILDIEQPSLPTVVSTWSDWREGGEGPLGSLHSVVPLPYLIGDRHYTLLGPEFAGHPDTQPSGTVWVLDTTDPAQPRAAAAWTLPHDVEWDGTYMFSNHYLDAVGTTMFVSMYHGGLWAVDLTPLGSKDFVLLPSIGVFMPDDDSGGPAAVPARWAPTVEEVLPMPDGTLVTFDSNTGLYSIRFDAAAPMAAPEPWPIQAP